MTASESFAASWPVRYCGVSLAGFVVDFAGMNVLLQLGAEPAWARLGSLLCAMQVTFALNGLHVFGQLSLRSLPGQWVRYMLCNGFGNACNYWIYVTLVSSHWPFVGDPNLALAASSAAAWVINLLGTRFVVFPPRRRRPSPDTGPSPASPGSARP